MPVFPQQASEGLLTARSIIIDPEVIRGLDPQSTQFKDAIVNLYYILDKMANIIDGKDTGYYFTNEIANGQQFFQNPTISPATMQGQNPRFGFRTTVNFGALPNTATKSVPHNIPIDAVAGPQYTATRIIGAATDPATLTFIPIPFSSPVLADNIAVTVDNTNINVTTGSNRTNFTRCILWFDYLKQ